MKYREFWIDVEDNTEFLTAYRFDPGDAYQKFHLIEKKAYAEAVKLIEEMAGALDRANYQGDYYDQKPHKAMEVVYSNREAFEKYKQWKGGE